MSNSDLWQKYSRFRNESDRQELVLAYLHLVKRLADRLSVKLPPCLGREDLESSGIVGLIEAIEKYDPTLNVDFEAFAFHRIRGAIYDEIRRANWIPRTTWQKLHRLYEARAKLEREMGRSVTDRELAAQLGMQPGEIHKLNNHLVRLTPLALEESAKDEDTGDIRFVDIIPDPITPDPLQEVCTTADKDALTHAVNALNQRDRLVLALYYQEELTLKEIGQVLEISESRVCQLHSRAIARLRRKLTAREKIERRKGE